jgi:molybdenum cofactor biosynthesis enzyme MoaA
MTRFPLRLRAALVKARISPVTINGVRSDSPILRLDADELLHRASDQPVSREGVREILSGYASIVWIGGAEPLAHPGIGHLTRLIASSGHYLFLDTGAVALRARIHEFQPLPRFYFSVRFLGLEAEHDRRCGQAGTSRAALEGIRTAQLSGFFVCANVVVDARSDSGELAQLFEVLRGLDLDGAIISAGSRDVGSQRVADEARQRFLSAGWAAFSRCVDRAAPVELPQRNAAPREAASANAERGEFEESVQTR